MKYYSQYQNLHHTELFPYSSEHSFLAISIFQGLFPVNISHKLSIEQLKTCFFPNEFTFWNTTASGNQPVSAPVDSQIGSGCGQGIIPRVDGGNRFYKPVAICGDEHELNLVFLEAFEALMPFWAY